MLSLISLLASPSWRGVLQHELEKPYVKKLESYLDSCYEKEQVYPDSPLIFHALNLTPYPDVSVVVVGQDPYHGGQAHGLAFSVTAGTPPPPSLKNIYKAVAQQIGSCKFNQGDLTGWAQQGVLMLNSVLTVKKGLAASHQKQGWETLTDYIIQSLNEKPEPVIFVLWGNYAKEKGGIIDRRKHTVLESVHPSPFSAHKGFFNNQHFSTINEILVKQGRAAIKF